MNEFTKSVALAYKEPGEHHPTSFQIIKLHGTDRIVINSGIADFRSRVKDTANLAFADNNLLDKLFPKGGREFCRPITPEEQDFILGNSCSPK